MRGHAYHSFRISGFVHAVELGDAALVDIVVVEVAGTRQEQAEETLEAASPVHIDTKVGRGPVTTEAVYVGQKAKTLAGFCTICL